MRNTQLCLLLKALQFASEKHQNQKRKGTNPPPYINHPIKVAHLLCEVGGMDNYDLLIAAILHDTVEDTQTLAVEIEKDFGKTVAGLVLEVTNKKGLNKANLKQWQIDKTPRLSPLAKQLKLADVICNIQDVIRFCPPAHWSNERKVNYLLWAEQIVAGLRGCNSILEQLFDEWLAKGKQLLLSNS